MHTDDLSSVRTHQDNSLRCARSSRIMVILREAAAMAGNSNRLTDWIRLAGRGV